MQTTKLLYNTAMQALIATFLLIAAAELGDKTQLLTMGLASRYPFWEVLAGVAAATAVLMALAVGLGGIINQLIPAFYIQLLAGIVFILFGLWTIFGKEKEEEEHDGSKSPFWIIFSSFFLAELGDKTQLATLALSAQYGSPLLVWLGAVSGMVLVNSLAALVGSWTKKFLPEKTIKLISAVVFIGFGIATLWGLRFLDHLFFFLSGRTWR